MEDGLVGMIGRRLVRKRGAALRSQDPADFEDRFIQVLDIVGASHCLVQVISQRHSIVVEIASLKRYAWFNTIEEARRETVTIQEDESA